MIIIIIIINFIIAKSDTTNSRKVTHIDYFLFMSIKMFFLHAKIRYKILGYLTKFGLSTLNSANI